MMYKLLVLLFCIYGSHAQRTLRILGGVEPSVTEETEAKAEPYSFSYSADTDDGGSSSREESGDDTGRVTGFYTLLDADGRQRRVEYVADENGFRAVVTTNEIGTESRNPADVIIESSAPTAEELVARYAAEFGSRTTISREAEGPNTIITRTPVAGSAGSIGVQRQGTVTVTRQGSSSVNVQPGSRTIVRTVSRPSTSTLLVNDGVSNEEVSNLNIVRGGGRRVILTQGGSGSQGGVIRTTTTTRGFSSSNEGISDEELSNLNIVNSGGRRVILSQGGSGSQGGVIRTTTTTSRGLGGSTLVASARGPTITTVRRANSGFIIPEDDGLGGNIIRTTGGNTRTFTTGTTTIRRTIPQPVSSFVTNSNRFSTNRVVVQPLTETTEDENSS